MKQMLFILTFVALIDVRKKKSHAGFHLRLEYCIHKEKEKKKLENWFNFFCHLEQCG